MRGTHWSDDKHGSVTMRTDEPETFSALGVSPDLVDVLDKAGMTTAFPVQRLCIPDALAGRDVCGKAKTGSGKTLAFGLPLAERVSAAAAPQRPTGLVLVPTRELAVQVAEVHAAAGRPPAACGSSPSTAAPRWPSRSRPSKRAPRWSWPRRAASST